MTKSDKLAPKSYNTQVGGPVTLKLEVRYETAVIEAGIFEPGEMKSLARIIRPIR
jgi:alanine racemase